MAKKSMGTGAEADDLGLLTRREAIRRVSAMLGGVAFVGGTALLTACEGRPAPGADSTAASSAFSAEDIAFLDEVADTILPTTSTPGAKAANTGAFIALMVTDTYDPKDQKVFRDGMKTLDDEMQKANKVGFVAATPAQRLALLERIDRESRTYMDARDEAQKRGKEGAESDKFLGDQRQENVAGGESNPAPAISADAPSHYFRMIKELTMLGYFTSEVGMTKAQRYIESPGRFDPCVPYVKGEQAWAGHA